MNRVYVVGQFYRKIDKLNDLIYAINTGEKYFSKSRVTEKHLIITESSEETKDYFKENKYEFLLELIYD